MKKFFLIVFIGASIFFFPHAAEFLVCEDRFSHADMAVVLSGEPTSRALAVGELYEQGKVGTIVVIPEPANPNRKKLLQLGLVEDEDHIPTARRILIAMKVPESQIIVTPSASDGTPSEALLVRQFLHGQYPRTLVLVTGRVSSRRARFIFRRAFRGIPIHILSAPTCYDSFQAQRWWTNPKNALRVVEEYEKFLVNAVTLLPPRLSLSECLVPPGRRKFDVG